MRGRRPPTRLEVLTGSRNKQSSRPGEHFRMTGGRCALPTIPIQVAVKPCARVDNDFGLGWHGRDKTGPRERRALFDIIPEPIGTARGDTARSGTHEANIT